ncbi:MAG: WD40 repeat domain-containing protein [Ilumatobacteraceae bacterium]
MIGHNGAVNALDFNTAGTVLASGGADKTIRLWDPATGQPVGGPLTGHTSAITDVEFRDFGTQLVSASNDGTVRVWDTATGQQVAGPLEADRLIDATYFYDSRTHRSVELVTIGEDGFIRLWDAVTGQSIDEFETRNSHGFTRIAFVNDEEDRPLIATPGGDGAVHLWGN